MSNKAITEIVIANRIARPLGFIPVPKCFHLWELISLKSWLLTGKFTDIEETLITGNEVLKPLRIIKRIYKSKKLRRY